MSSSKNNGNVALIVAFAATAIIYVRRSRRRRRSQSIDRSDTCFTFGDNSGSETSIPPGLRGRIGSRGMAALGPSIPYLDGFLKCLLDACDPVANPHGHIAVCVAENKLVTEHLAERLMQPGTATSAFSDSIVYGYNGFLGLPQAREAVAYFVARKFLCPDEPHLSPELALERVRPEHVALGSGCAALLNYLFFALAEEGDAVLIPAPYYAAFESDMRTIAKCVAVPIMQSDPIAGPSISELNAATNKARRQGLNPKIILLTNPNNPLGTVYEPGVVKRTIRWARSRGMHTMVDEIYALSVRDQESSQFESVLCTMDNDLGNDVHFLWALSKDFASSGFRVGVLYTQNEALLRTLQNLNIFSGVSHPMQLIVAEILTDNEFVDTFLDRSREQLVEAYKICTRKLDEMLVPYIVPEAGMFVYADFSKMLPSQTPEGEARFAALVQDVARVVMTPGQSMRDPRPGWFRICMAYISHEVLEIALERISRLALKIKAIGWDHIDPSLIKVL
mmetsp:Transcript_12047/g.26085  ORF Transcript_12047/g.26085 Transcript_12047/m.26085 type:complete len:507 (-) Transcript_12047:31-1551(-)